MANFLQDAAQAVATGRDECISKFWYLNVIRCNSQVIDALMLIYHDFCIGALLRAKSGLVRHAKRAAKRSARSATGRDGAELIADDTRQAQWPNGWTSCQIR